MNQILNNSGNYEQENNEIEYSKKIHSKYVFFLRWQFGVSITILLVSIFYFIFSYSSNNDNTSKQLLNTRNIASLYDQSYIASPITANNNTFEIIGIISIDKINITYPILSHMNDELLKIAPCKFYGPDPNKTGNLCIAGHNFNNSTFFSNLNKLEINDIINIYDNYGNILEYQIYYIDEVDNSDTSCTSQETFQKKEVTLVTCNNLNKKRIIVKAREI